MVLANPPPRCLACRAIGSPESLDTSSVPPAGLGSPDGPPAGFVSPPPPAPPPPPPPRFLPILFASLPTPFSMKGAATAVNSPISTSSNQCVNPGRLQRRRVLYVLPSPRQ